MVIKICNYDVLIDDEDYDSIISRKWYIHKCNGGPYFRSTNYMDDPYVSLHHFIINAERQVTVDHKNNNTLDNRKENLRICDQHKNTINKSINKSSITKYKGVDFHVKTGKYRSRISCDGIIYHLGLFDDPKIAHEAYCKKAMELFGEYANFG